MLVVAVAHLFTQGVMTGRCRGITELAGAPHCLIHPDDAARLGVSDRALVELTTAHGAVVLQARVSETTVPGQVLVPRGYDGLPPRAVVGRPDALTPVDVRPLVGALVGGAE